MNFLEILACSLNRWCHDSDDDEWRQEPERRVKVRREAGRILDELEDSGLTVRVHRSARVKARVAEIVTIPARPAYDPSSEVDEVYEEASESDP